MSSSRTPAVADASSSTGLAPAQGAVPLPPTVWRERNVDESVVAAVAEACALPSALSRVLVGRGVGSVDEARAFLAPSLKALPDPLRLAGVDAALDRLCFAIARDEIIGVFGDYDVDGVTSTTLLSEVLERVGARVACTIPDRLVEGYGLSRAGVDRLAAAGCRLIVTVDCGVTAHEEVAYAAQQGIDVVVIDHHTVPIELPRAVSVINPHRPDCTRGSEMLCAVGVTFNLALALRRKLREDGFFTSLRPEPDLRDMLDLVALGTVADVVPLVGENRILVSHGLKLIREGRRAGMRALLEVAAVDPRSVGAGDLGYQLGPRVNAAGRLGDAMQGVQLLRARSDDEARDLAVRLDTENAARRDLEKAIVQAAIEQVEGSRALREARAIVVGDDSWHPGVVGIVASRLVDRFGRPAVVVGQGGRGSGRSIERFHLYDALRAVSSTLDGFGGHAHAAGVRVGPGRFEQFREALLDHAAARLQPEDLHKVAHHDGALALRDVTPDFIARLAVGAPWGRKNPEPSFVFRGLVASDVRVLRGAHLKARIAGETPVDVIAFGAGARAAEFAGPVDVLASPEINEFRGRRTLQLRVRDFVPSEHPRAHA